MPEHFQMEFLLRFYVYLCFLQNKNNILVHYRKVIPVYGNIYMNEWIVYFTT